MTHYGIPWPVFRAAVRTIRRLLSRERTTGIDYLVTDASIDRLRTVFGRHHFTNAWELSFHYQGEQLNMRRPEYDDTDDRPWKQTHVRGFIEEEGVLLYPHLEYEPTEYPDAHYHGENIDIGAGIEQIAVILDREAISYERIEV